MRRKVRRRVLVRGIVVVVEIGVMGITGGGVAVVGVVVGLVVVIGEVIVTAAIIITVAVVCQQQQQQ